MTDRPTLFLDASRYVLMKNGVPHTRVMTIDDDKRCQSITDVPWTLLWDGGNESIWRRPEIDRLDCLDNESRGV